MPMMAPRRVGNDVVGDQRRAGAGGDRDAMPMSAMRTTLPVTVTFAQVLTPAEHDARGRRILDHVAVTVLSPRPRCRRPPESPDRCGGAAGSNADDCLHDGEPSALVEMVTETPIAALSTCCWR